MCLHQIIHLKRFQFFNGRWVKSQRVVRFPASDLDPLRYTVQNGNGTMENGTETDRTGTETQTSGSQPVEGQNESSSLPEGQPETPESRVVESDICGSPNIANGGEHPLEPPPSSDSTGAGAEGGERKSKSSDELNETLHRRKGNIYNLFAITVSGCAVLPCLVVCLTFLASFFLPSSSLINMHILVL